MPAMTDHQKDEQLGGLVRRYQDAQTALGQLLQQSAAAKAAHEGVVEQWDGLQGKGTFVLAGHEGHRGAIALDHP